MDRRTISIEARVTALDCLIEEIGTKLSWWEADTLIDYAAARLERDETEGAINTLTMGTDYTGALRLVAVLETS